MNNKVIVCDLDGTLAPSKSALERDMAEIICQLLNSYQIAIVSGGSYEQFKKQFLSQLICEGDILKNMYLFPTNGNSCYVYDSLKFFKKAYEEVLTLEEKREIISAFEKAIAESSIDVSNPFGQIIEDRGGQITFSGRGQLAPLSEKEKWDPYQTKRQKIIEILKKYIPNYEIRIGGATSIDITHKGINKAYAIKKIQQILNVDTKDIVFFGDALFEGGNDSSVIDTGVECISVSGPSETIEIFKKYLE